MSKSAHKGRIVVNRRRLERQIVDTLAEAVLAESLRRVGPEASQKRVHAAVGEVLSKVLEDMFPPRGEQPRPNISAINASIRHAAPDKLLKLLHKLKTNPQDFATRAGLVYDGNMRKWFSSIGILRLRVGLAVVGASSEEISAVFRKFTAKDHWFVKRDETPLPEIEAILLKRGLELTDLAKAAGLSYSGLVSTCEIKVYTHMAKVVAALDQLGATNAEITDFLNP